MTYTIYDMQGQIALEHKVTGSHQNTLWDISKVPSGTYAFVMSHKGKRLVSKTLIVE
jgi:Secretion system C-terminal sorting domain